MIGLRQKAWSPYTAGIIIGLLQIPAFLVLGSALGASSCYVSVAGFAASVCDAGAKDLAYFGGHMTRFKYALQGSMVLGIAIGAYLSMKYSGATREWYSRIWKKAMGIGSFPQRLAVGFIGGFIMLFGARWAGGCTSGHGLSGIGQLALGSIVATASFFIGGIIVSNLFKRV